MVIIKGKVFVDFSFKHAVMNDCSGRRMGQNLAYTAGSPKNLNRMVGMWVDEKADYNYASNSCSNVCGHYTQVVWAETTKVREPLMRQ